MKADLLVAEIGSTTTVVSAVGLEPPRLLGQGFAATLQQGGDVTAALERAVENLAAGPGCELDWNEFAAASSAAGGLSMSVHGLVYEMTVKAAREAALGAGAVLKMITAGKMTAADMEQLLQIKPKMILLAGGVDYGEKETALHNARLIAGLRLGVPVVYAGNVAARAELAAIFETAGVKARFVDNVYPRVDELVVEPARRVIQEVFEEHIVTAPGMERIRSMVGGPILPTPGAVMEACKLLQPLLGDLCAVDVGGATTDVHSVARGSPEIQAILESPEPAAKRTVEGDLGIHVNARNIAGLLGDSLERELGFDPVSYTHLDVYKRQEYTGAGKHPGAQLDFARNNGITVKRGDPRENRPGQAIVIPEHFSQLGVVEMDLDRMRRSLIRNAVERSGVAEINAAELTFLAAETGKTEAFVAATLKELGGISINAAET